VEASASSIGTWSDNSGQIGSAESCIGLCVATPVSLAISESLAEPHFISIERQKYASEAHKVCRFFTLRLLRCRSMLDGFEI
jgi:hypothetical protein